jgi:hypothetical protein
MIRASVDLQLGDLRIGELRLWEHPLDGASDRLSWLALNQVAEDLFLMATWVT